MCEARIENIEQRIISRPEDALFYFKRFKDYQKEHCFAIYLNAKNKVTRLEVITIGSLYGNLVHPREVFAPAFEERSAAVIIGHNHPSGDSSPSPEDVAMTYRLKEAGDILGIELLDHIVVSAGEWSALGKNMEGQYNNLKYEKEESENETFQMVNVS